MKGQKGLTLVELLVAFILLALVSAMIYRGYVTILRHTSDIFYVAKDEREVRTFIYQLVKDVKAVGFGAGKNEIDNTLNIQGVLTSCQFPSGSVPVIARCPESGGHDQLFMLSLVSRDILESGCWGFVDANDCLRASYVDVQSPQSTLYADACDPNVNPDYPKGCNILSVDSLGRRCADVLYENRSGVSSSKFLFLDQYRLIKGGNILSGVCNQDNGCPYPYIRCTGYSNTQFIYFGNNNFSYPDDFLVRYYLSSTNVPDECAPNTFNLNRQINGGVAQPILSCVATFFVYYGEVDDFGNMNYVSQLSTINNEGLRKLKSVVLCMAVQIGRLKAKSQTSELQFGSKCGNVKLTFDDERKFYRWKIIEEEVPIRNIGSFATRR